MSAKLRMSLKSTPINLPIGWDDFELVIERDQDTRYPAALFSGDVTFWGKAYHMIYDEFFNNGYCAEMDCLVEILPEDSAAWETLIDGAIYLVDINEFDETDKKVKTQILDKQFSRLIKQNWKKTALIKIGKSLDGTTITACPTVDIDFFDPTDILATYAYANRKCFKVIDVLTFLTKYISNNTWNFESDFFDTGGDGEGAVISLGSNIRDSGNNDSPETSLYQMFTELNKKYNLTFGVVEIGGTQTIKMEKYEDIFTAVESLLLTNIKNLKTKLDKSQTYSVVRIGSSTTTTGSYPQTRFRSFQDESYATGGNCNIDAELNLVSDFIIDSNVIEAVTGGDTSYDDDIFLVITNLTTAIKYDVFSAGPPYSYNDPLSNYKVAQNWIGGIPASIIKYTTNTDNKFRARKTATSFAGDIGSGDFGVDVIADDDSVAPYNDAGGNYNNATGRFVAPSGGIYQFRFRPFVNTLTTFITNSSYSKVRMTTQIIRKDSGDVTIATYSSIFDIIIPHLFYPELKTFATGTITTSSLTNIGRLTDASATFVTDGVAVGNFVKAPGGQLYGVLSVDSETQLTTTRPFWFTGESYEILHPVTKPTEIWAAGFIQTPNIAMDATDYVIPHIEFEFLEGDVGNEPLIYVMNQKGGLFTEFECNFFETDSGELQAYDPKDVRNIIHNFEKSISFEDFKNIEQHRNRYLLINEGSDYSRFRRGYVQRITYKPIRNTASFQLMRNVSNDNNIILTND